MVDYKEILWQRLNEKYGRKSAVADAVLFDVFQYSNLNDGDANEFPKFVSSIEHALTDLKRLNMESELKNCNVISEIEARLPPRMRREWSEEFIINMSEGNEEKFGREDKFDCLLEFLRHHLQIQNCHFFPLMYAKM